jgi:signal transduction histidine kinase
VAIPEQGRLKLEIMDAQGTLQPSPWPQDWARTRQYLEARASGHPDAGGSPDSFVTEIPDFGPGDQRGARERDWLLVEFDPAYLRNRVFPDLAAKYLAPANRAEYEIAVVDRGTETIYESSPGISSLLIEHSDAQVSVLDSGLGFLSRGGPGPGRGPGPPPGGNEKGPKRSKRDPPSNEPGRWRLLARHRAGSLEALVEQTRLRNLAISAGLLLLILATAGALFHYSRQAQRLAEARMNFVAGVSHELRTPLTVIRTAAFNLRGKLAHSPDHVERYGNLIQGEAERLSALVEQVLQFAKASSSSVLGEVGPRSAEDLIRMALETSGIQTIPGMVIDRQIQPNLPLVLADEVAASHAIANLLDNAAKHAAAVEPWIGIRAKSATDSGKAYVEISVVDRGPGIPPEEQSSIFEPFQRGRRAITGQVRGTGLGLNLVKKIAEAHGGSIRLSSVPLQETEFVLRLPAASAAPINAPAAPVIKEGYTHHELPHPAD